jgi:hypothetical protein
MFVPALFFYVNKIKIKIPDLGLRPAASCSTTSAKTSKTLHFIGTKVARYNMVVGNPQRLAHADNLVEDMDEISARKVVQKHSTVS